MKKEEVITNLFDADMRQMAMLKKVCSQLNLYNVGAKDEDEYTMDDQLREEASLGII